MPVVLCLNPGSNSLKFDFIDVDSDAVRASDGARILTGSSDDIGKETTLEVFRDDKKIFSKKLDAGDFGAATESVLDALDELKKDKIPGADCIELAAVRVVHGGSVFDRAVPVNDDVMKEIKAHAELAPLHNPNALKVIDAVRRRNSSLPISAAFDTAFHRTLPERAWRYPLEIALADRHKIRKYGFHGISHRYMLEQFAHLSGTGLRDSSVITMHLEGGSSVTAIENGRSVETSMGFTPLEGLMMATRCGSIDPAILPFLMEKEGISAEEALKILEKRSGLLGVSGESPDTRVLRKRKDARSLLAMEMFGYRVRLTVGAYLAALGKADAIVFGGGIGENTPEVRSMVCEGLKKWGVALDDALNETTLSGDALISRPESSLEIWVLHSDEGKQLAFECASAAQ